MRTKEEKLKVGERGMSFYENDIAPRLTDADRGCYVAIDVNAGEWEIDDTRNATVKLRERVPDANVFLLRHIDIATGYFGGCPRGFFNEDWDGSGSWRVSR